MSPALSPDTKAVVRAAEALTAQVRRVADALTTTVTARPRPDDEDQRSGSLVPPALMDALQRDEAARAEHAATVEAATALAGLQEQLAAPIDRILLDWPEHNRTDEHEAVRNELLEAVLAIVLPSARIIAGRARDAEADVQRVTDLYERWVKAGPPPLGAPLARWWDARLVELREAVLGTKDPS